MFDRPSTPVGQTQPADWDPRTPPPPPNRGPGRAGRLLLPQPPLPPFPHQQLQQIQDDAAARRQVANQRYRLAGTQVPSAQMSFNPGNAAAVQSGSSLFGGLLPTAPTAPSVGAGQSGLLISSNPALGASTDPYASTAFATNPVGGGNNVVSNNRFSAIRAASAETLAAFRDWQRRNPQLRMQWRTRGGQTQMSNNAVLQNNPAPATSVFGNGNAAATGMAGPSRQTYVPLAHRRVGQVPALLRTQGQGHADRVSNISPMQPTGGPLTFAANDAYPADAAVFAFGAQIVGSAEDVEGPPLKKKRTVGKHELAGLAISMNDRAAKEIIAYFPFMKLPAEIRNMVYELLCDDMKQALLVHCQRMATLRARTRLDRGTALPDLDPEDDTRPTTGRNAPLERKNSRPAQYMTQVCRQLRSEFMPIFMAKHEVGIDLNNVDRYLRTFYDYNDLTDAQKLAREMPFKGNLTIALNSVVKPVEYRGVEVVELLVLWACSVKMEAGFGRYSHITYNPHTDGEAKDMYRLFGRTVLADRKCGPMNRVWRRHLRGKHLASVMVHRRKVLGQHIPKFHILFKPGFAEPWMRTLDSPIPAGWLAERGLAGMQYFEVKVGKWEPGHYMQHRYRYSM